MNMILKIGSVRCWFLLQSCIHHRQQSANSIIKYGTHKIQDHLKPFTTVTDYAGGILSEVNTDSESALHTPVMAKEVLEILKPKDEQIFIDMTFGAGGHTKTLLQHAPHAKIFAVDRDSAAFTIADGLAKKKSNLIPLHGCFSEVHQMLDKHGCSSDSIDGILFDVGMSSMQLDQSQRGFSISKNGPLDMRMDTSRPEQVTAADVVNHLSEEGLHQIFRKYGEEKKARLIARAIVDSRSAFGRITTTSQLADIVASVYQGTHREDMLKRHSHVATKTFQALRIFVNNELNELYNGLVIAHDLLKPGGICVVIAFHSLEDRIIKRHFHGIDMDEAFNMSVSSHHRNSAKIHSMEDIKPLLQKKWEPVRKQAILPTSKEVEINPRSRSAKLRAARKLES